MSLQIDFLKVMMTKQYSIARSDRLKRKRPDLWSLIERFRAETDLEELDIEQILEGVRDRSVAPEPEI